MRVAPLAAALGAEITGIKNAGTLDQSEFQAVRDALHRYSIIVIRDQRLTPAEQITFSRRFGPLRVSFYNKYAVPDHPELTVVSNIVEDGRAIGIADAGMLWHTDASYLKTPDMYSLLYAIEIPHQDGKPLGDTVFASAAAAYEALPDTMKRRIAPLRAVHSFERHLEKKARLGNLKRGPLTAAQKAETPDVDHPVVRTHPVTGRKSLFVTEGHTSSIVGLAEEESRTLLESLWEHLKKPEFQYRHSWRAGDLVVWDNCAAHHLAMFDYGSVRRRLHRAGVAGGVPE